MIIFRVLPRIDGGVTAFNTSAGKIIFTPQTPNYPRGPQIMRHVVDATTTMEVCALEARRLEWTYEGTLLRPFLSLPGIAKLTPVSQAPQSAKPALVQGIEFELGTFLALQHTMIEGVTVYINRGPVGDEIRCYEHSQASLGPGFELQIFKDEIIVNGKVIFKIQNLGEKNGLAFNMEETSKLNLRLFFRKNITEREKELSVTSSYPLRNTGNPIFILRSRMGYLAFSVYQDSDGVSQFEFLRF